MLFTRFSSYANVFATRCPKARFQTTVGSRGTRRPPHWQLKPTGSVFDRSPPEQSALAFLACCAGARPSVLRAPVAGTWFNPTVESLGELPAPPALLPTLSPSHPPLSFHFRATRQSWKATTAASVEEDSTSSHGSEDPLAAALALLRRVASALTRGRQRPRPPPLLSSQLCPFPAGASLLAFLPSLPPICGMLAGSQGRDGSPGTFPGSGAFPALWWKGPHGSF